MCQKDAKQGKGGETPVNSTVTVEIVLLLKRVGPKETLNCGVLNYTIWIFVFFFFLLLLFFPFDLVATLISHFSAFPCHSGGKKFIVTLMVLERLMISEVRSIENCPSVEV